MESRMLLVALVLQLSLVALGGAAERCAQPGALRCEEGRHQSVCLERSRVWHRVSDCAAAGGFCADGRCVSGVDGRDAGEKCNSQTDKSKCSKDCTGIDVCQITNVYATIKCGSGQLCDDTNGAKCVAASQAGCTNTFQCSFAALLPDLSNGSIYYDCSESDGTAVKKICAEDEGFFNACEGSCDAKLEAEPMYVECDYSGFSFSLYTNPSLYVICIDKNAFWGKCEEGYYNIYIGKCTGSSVYCTNCKSDGDGDPSETSPSGTTPLPPSSTTEIPATPNPAACFGPTDRIPDPTDACWYYYCLASGELERRRCDVGTIFVAMYRKCVPSNGACT